MLFFSALAFVWLNKQGLYPPELHSTNLDAEWVYRKFLPAGVQRGLAFAHNAKKSTVAATVVHMNSIRRSLSESSIAKYNLSESWPTGSMVLWISFTLVAYLLLDIFIYK
ncbi:MAG: hypothetical protein B6D74_15295 [gamma proteobacterium symbiont of Ctena orbiculata]|nr:MAG: hypothetical protein B6D74_15295 [gamma proteobacterium symbiont of Ctena orbiculata]